MLIVRVDLWESIKIDLDRDDVSSAAFKLRRGSEDYFESVCDALGARLTYNSGTQWQLDDWLPAAMEEYKKLLARGRRVASSWGNQTAVDELTEMESVRTQVYGRTYAEAMGHQCNCSFQQLGEYVQAGLHPSI